ncbi:hypothetical protein QCM77_41705 [Bradyrhizobium sp. SSUT18]|uniref:hypothetical protein n=1 Tax=Bradyrhizobium sp. SSUT18 TaxID=3040602 RepID=UPI00244D27A8|nr:hypothetical protein [Bradyrhizobium sp. SSUT18]MDH2406344.1 hypothetical protein [Bradyrhizobium sp. SSUT18]
MADDKLSVALVGSRLIRLRGGAWWFFGETVPPKLGYRPRASDSAALRQYSELIFERAIEILRRSKVPIKRDELAQALEPEIRDLTSGWLPQRLKFAKKAGVLDIRDGG